MQEAEMRAMAQQSERERESKSREREGEKQSMQKEMRGVKQEDILCQGGDG
jgi:hypothetical protein